MTEPQDIGPTAWRIWNAMVNGEGLPLTVTETDLLDLTENEAMTLDRIRSRKGLSVEFDQKTGSQTIFNTAPKCASDGCENVSTQYFESGGVGSYFCDDCSAKVSNLNTDQQL